MPRFFCDAIAGGKAVITGEDAAHIARSLRMQPGERLTLSDGQGTDFDCVLDLVTPQEVFLTVLESYPCRTEPSVYVRLYMAMPKAEKLELIVQKAVELGVHEVIPVATRRAVVKLDRKKEESKLKRWNAIAESAAKQSGRMMIPQVHGVLTMKEAFAYAKGFDVNLIPYELAEGMKETKAILEQVKPGMRVGIFIGPEGGFEEQEIGQARNAGAVPVTLGRRILRTETAGITTLSILMYHLECAEVQ